MQLIIGQQHGVDNFFESFRLNILISQLKCSNSGYYCMRIAYSDSQTKKDSTMRKRFEQQLGLGQLPIEATCIDPKSKNSLDQLLAALKAIYCNKKYNQEIFVILEGHINLN